MMLFATMFAVVALSLCSTADADVVRKAKGWLEFEHCEFWSGPDLIGWIPDIEHVVEYADGTGKYGGRYSRKGRKKAKDRAVALVKECCETFIKTGDSERTKSKCDIESKVSRPHPHFDPDQFCRTDSRITGKVNALKKEGFGPIRVTMKYRVHGDAGGNECDRVYHYRYGVACIH